MTDQVSGLEDGEQATLIVLAWLALGYTLGGIMLGAAAVGGIVAAVARVKRRRR